MAFKFAGERGDQLAAALDAAAQQRAKLLDTGRVLFDQGIASRGSSKEFERVGAGSEFAEVANDPQLAPGLYDKAEALLTFNDYFG
jgi:hypothetical protein